MAQQKDRAKPLQEGSHLHVQGNGLQKNQINRHLGLGLLVSRTVRKFISVIEVTQFMVFGIHGPMNTWRMTVGVKVDKEGWEEKDF